MNFIFDPSLVLYLPLYELDGSSFASKDAYGHTCTVTGALWRPNGHYFDGTDDKITISHTASLQPGTKSFSVIVWVNPVSVTGVSLGLLNKGGNVPGYDFRLRANGTKIQIQIHDGTTRDTPEVTLESALTASNYYCIGLGIDRVGNKAYVYMNGLKETNEGTLTATGAIEGSNNIVIGVDYDTNYINATIGELAIYHRLLTPPEFMNYYLATKWRYR